MSDMKRRKFITLLGGRGGVAARGAGAAAGVADGSVGQMNDPRRTRHGAAVTLTCEQVAVAPLEVIEGDIAVGKSDSSASRGCP
jgi:hypothetical protein